MHHNPKISIIIPALNEEESIEQVLNDIPGEIVEEVIVVDNGSSDNTVTVSKGLGANVILEPLKGMVLPASEEYQFLSNILIL